MASAAEVNWILTHETDYYGMLGVSTSADDATLRKRYYALTLKLHPDKNPNDERAALACRHVMDAYSVLKDPSRRKVYDTYGTQGISRLDQMGGEIPSISEMLRTIGTFLTALFLRFVGRRFLCLEKLPKLFPFTNETEGGDDPDADAGLDEVSRAARAERKREMLFVKQHAADRARTRRFVFTLLLVALVVIVGLDRHARRTSSSSSLESAPNATALTPVRPMSALFPTPGSAQLGTPFTFDYDCLPRTSAAAMPTSSEDFAPEAQARFLACQHRSNRTGTVIPSHVLTLHRYGGSEAMAQLGFYDYLMQRCALEKELAWASRERYEKLATVRRVTPLLTPKSPNQAPRRKYPKHTWRPKFMESFTVESEDELFQFSPLCQPLLSR